jgi:hypothetical protein
MINIPDSLEDRKKLEKNIINILEFVDSTMNEARKKKIIESRFDESKRKVIYSKIIDYLLNAEDKKKQ